MAQDRLTIGEHKKRKYKIRTLGPHVFRMSHYGQRDYVLKMWLLHFKRLGVPAAIIKSRRGHSVWKYGLEYVSTHSPPPLKSATGEIIEEVNNFSEYWPKRQKKSLTS